MMLRLFKAGILATLLLSFAAKAQDPGYAVSSISLNSGGLGCLACSVDNEANALGNTPQTFSTITGTLGALEGFVSQTLVFNEAGQAGDSVTVLISLEEALLLDLNLLGNFTMSTALGAAENGENITLASGGVTALSGNKVYFTMVAGSSFDRVVLRLNNTVLNLLSELNVYLARIEKFAFAGLDGFDFCDKPTTHTSGTEGICLLCETNNEVFAYDSDPSSGSSMSIPVGLLNGAVFQRFFWDEPSCSTDSLYIQFGIPDGLVQANLLGNVSVTPFFNGVPGNPMLLDTTYVGVLNEGVKYGAVLFPGQAFDAIEIRMTGVVDLLMELNVFDICMLRQAPPRSAEGAVVDVCYGDDVVVNLETTPSTLSRWYLTPTGGTPLIDDAKRTIYADGDSMLIRNNTETVTYYLESFNTNNGCTSIKRDSVIVSVYPQVPSALIPDTLITCYNDATSIVPQPAGSIFRFYQDADATIPLDTGSSLYAENIISDTSFYVVNTYLDICPDTNIVEAFVKVLDDLVSPGLNDTMVFCSTTEAVQIDIPNPDPGAIYRWYETEGQSVNAPTVTGTTFEFPNGITENDTIYVEAQKGFCDEGRRYPIYIFASDLPDVDVPDTLLYVCEDDSVNVFATSTNPLGQFAWYDSETATTPVFEGNPFIVQDNGGTQVFYVETKFANCASDERKMVEVVSVTELTNNLADLSGGACIGEDLVMELVLDIPDLQYRWYDVDDNLIAENESFTVPNLTTDTAFYLEIDQLPCLGMNNRFFVEIFVVDKPTLTIDGEDRLKFYCAGDSVNLFGNPSQDATIKWYESQTGTDPLIVGNPVMFLPPASFADTTVIWAEGAIGRCGSSDRIGVGLIRSDDIAKAVVDAPVICKGDNVTLNATSQIPNSTFTWWDAAVNGNQIGAGAAYNTGVLNADATYYVANVFDGICSGTERTEVTVVVEEVLEKVTASCSDSTGSDFVEFVWTPVTDVVEYVVSINNGTPFTVAGTETSYVVSGLEPSTTVQFSIQAKAILDCSLSNPTVVSCTSEMCSQILTQFDQPDYDVCEGETAEIVLTNLPNNAIVSYNGSLISGDRVEFTPGIMDTTYNLPFRVWVANQPMCDTLDLVAQVHSHSNPEVNISVEVISPQALGQRIDEFRFINESVDNNSWFWNFGDGLTSTEHSPTHKYAAEGEYMVTLRVTSAFGCVTLDSLKNKLVVSDNPEIFIPNSFTPNGDGMNDTWRVFAKSIKEGRVRVFNQYGNRVFDSGNPESGSWEAEWDGTYNGEELPSGVFVYQVVLVDGFNIKYEREGNINLIRK